MHEQRQTDVLVIGGGMAGVSAALAARRCGGQALDVLLIDPSNVLGGQGTAGGVAGFCGDTERVNDVFRELVRRLGAHGLIAEYDPNADRRPYDLEWCAFFLQEMLGDAGVDFLLHTMVLDAQAEDSRVTSVTLATPDGACVVRPRFVIDATGRCIVPAKAGFAVDHLGANEQLPMSLYFTLWDTHRRVEPILPPNCPTWSGDDDLPMTSLHRFDSGKLEVKMKVVGFDAADASGLSQAEVFARRQMAGLIYHLQTRGYRGKHYETYALASVSRHIGVREQRRIVAEHTLTQDEIMRGCVFDDAVAVGTYHLDYHWPDRMQRAGTGITTLVEPYHIPLRCMIPRGAQNVLVPGRGAGGDQMAMSSFRVMATVAQMGFACGMAAKQSIEQSAPIAAMDVKPLQEEIERGGQALNLSVYGEYLRGRLMIHEHAFEEDRPFAQCHASSLVHLPDNRFLVAYFGGTREGHVDVGIWLSERWQGGWSVPKRVAKIADQPHWNPVLFRSPAGPLLLYFKVGSSPRTWRTWMMRSDDLGRSWSEAAELASEDKIARGPVRCKPLVLSDGTVLAPGSDEGKDDDQLWRVFIDRSDDGGFTFKPGDLLPLDTRKVTGRGVIQPTLWESAPGRVHMLMRSTGGWACRADSSDGGRTWSEIYPTDLPNNNKGLDIVRFADGTLALAANPVSEGQSPLAILLSTDNGHTWPRRLDVENEPDQQYIYPALVATPRGMALSYTWHRQRIAFWHGSVEQIHQAAAPLIAAQSTLEQ